MIFTDLRQYVATLEKLGQLKVIEGASCELEIGAITEMATSQANSPAVLFDSIPGHKKGFRVLTNFLAHKTRERMVYGVDENLTDSEAVKHWKNKLKTFSPTEPKQIESGPVKENVMVGDDVDLTKFPWPRWHQRDGGPYICATAVVTRDPDSGYINVGSYRYMLLGKNRIVAHVGSGHHGDVIRKKYWAKGQSVSGGNIAWPGTGTVRNRRHQSELGCVRIWLRRLDARRAGGSHQWGDDRLADPRDGRSRARRRDVAARRRHTNRRTLGEMSGYYGGGARPAPVTVIKSVLYRNDPIILGAPPFLGASRGILSSRGILLEPVRSARDSQHHRR